MTAEPVTRALDLEVALRADGHRWVQWSEQGPATASPGGPGRFLAPAQGLLSHLQVPAGEDVPLAVEPYRHLRPYTSDPGLALAVAERVGLFGDGGAALTRSPAGVWRLAAASCALELEDRSVARLLCRAVLAWVDAADRERST